MDLQELGSVVTRWVEFGGRRHDDRWDDVFERLHRDAPDAFRHAPPWVYRAMVLPETCLHGSSIHVEARRFASWSETEEAARMVLREKAQKMIPGEVGIILEARSSWGDCIANIPAIYRALGFDLPEVHGWSLYAEREREVVFRQGKRMQCILENQIVDILCHGDPELFRPFRGEPGWSSDTEFPFVIGGIPDDQPDAATGTWWVEPEDAGGLLLPVSWNANARSWDVDECLEICSFPEP